MTTKMPPPPQRSGAAAPPEACEMQMPGKSGAGIRAVLVGVEGIGKTTIGAYAPDPVIIMAPDELGYLTLHSRGLVPTVPTMRPRNWPQLLQAVEGFARDVQGRKTIVLDAMAGLESMCAGFVCQTEFGGDWGEKGYQAYGRGKGITTRTWPQLLLRLTSCANKGMNVLLLGHARVRAFNSPDGPSYDRYECNVGTDEVWAKTKAWCESSSFLLFRPIVDQAVNQTNMAKAKGKAVAHTRVMRCAYSAVSDAKNQYGLQDEYTMPDDPAACAAAYWNLMLTTSRSDT